MANFVDGGESAMLETKLEINYCGDYERLGGHAAAETSPKWWWQRVILLAVFLLLATVVFVLVAGPLIMTKVVVPILNWTSTIEAPILGLSLFASIALFPALLLPSSPCMWIAGIAFGYGHGFLLIMAGMSIGMTLPFLIGSLFHQQIHRWLEKWPKKAAIIRLSGQGDWFHQFRAVALLRISPFPYIVYNYTAVATNVTYCPYIVGSLVGTIPDTFLTIYSGRLLRSLADVTTGTGLLSVQQVAYDGVGLCVAVATTAAITIYARNSLQTIQVEEELN